MQMTNSEIVRSYKNAENPSKQVGILAELNASDKKTIAGILNDAGVLDKKTQGAYRRRGLLPSEDAQPEAIDESHVTVEEVKPVEPDGDDGIQPVAETQESAERIPQSVVFLAQNELDRMRHAYQNAKITVEKYEELLDFVAKHGQ